MDKVMSQLSSFLRFEPSHNLSNIAVKVRYDTVIGIFFNALILAKTILEKRTKKFNKFNFIDEKCFIK